MANVVQRLECRVVVPKTRVRFPSFAPKLIMTFLTGHFLFCDRLF